MQYVCQILGPLRGCLLISQLESNLSCEIDHASKKRLNETLQKSRKLDESYSKIDDITFQQVSRVV